MIKGCGKFLGDGESLNKGMVINSCWWRFFEGEARLRIIYQKINI
jgi:hypothetical protein